MLNGASIIGIAIIIGGIVFIIGGIILFVGVASYSESVKEKFQVNATSTGLRSMMAKTAANALAPIINTFTQITKGFITSMASFLSLIGVGLCFLGFGLFKRKYLAWVLTLILMFVAIVIDVVGLGFVGGVLSHDSNSKGIVSADFAGILIGVLTAHLIANAFIIYYLTKKSTASIFRTTSG